MTWIFDLQEPYARHMFRAVSAHRKHKQQMNTGFRNEEITLDAFKEEDCNIDWEPHVINMMRGEYDQFQERMWEILQNDLPLDNPGLWTLEDVMAQAPELPATKWPPVEPGKKGKHTSSALPGQPSSTATAPTDQTSSNATTPAGKLPRRANLQNRSNIWYVYTKLV
jgi:hypothetical protein